MFESTLESYAEKVDPRFVPVVTALHDAIMQARPGLAVKVMLGALTYGLNGDYRHWVASVAASNETVTLRFLVGSFMRDPEMILHAGTGGIRTISFSSADEVDADVVGAYVNEAIIQLGAYRSL